MREMSSKQLVGVCLCFSLVIAHVIALPLGTSQSSSRIKQSVLSFLTGGWGPCTVEEEIEIAGYLKRQTESYFIKLEAFTIVEEEELDPEAFMGMPFVADEEAAEALMLMVANLMISLEEMINTLGLMESLFEQRPVDYAQTATILWLNIVKDIALEKENAKQIGQLGLVNSNWAAIAEVVLPRLFSRILEPRLAESLRNPSR